LNSSKSASSTRTAGTGVGDGVGVGLGDGVAVGAGELVGPKIPESRMLSGIMPQLLKENRKVRAKMNWRILRALFAGDMRTFL